MIQLYKARAYELEIFKEMIDRRMNGTSLEHKVDQVERTAEAGALRCGRNAEEKQETIGSGGVEGVERPLE